MGHKSVPGLSLSTPALSLGWRWELAPPSPQLNPFLTGLGNPVEQLGHG
jgi:hypothetical protein